MGEDGFGALFGGEARDRSQAALTLVLGVDVGAILVLGEPVTADAAGLIGVGLGDPVE